MTTMMMMTTTTTNNNVNAFLSVHTISGRISGRITSSTCTRIVLKKNNNGGPRTLFSKMSMTTHVHCAPNSGHNASISNNEISSNEIDATMTNHIMNKNTTFVSTMSTSGVVQHHHQQQQQQQQQQPKSFTTNNNNKSDNNRQTRPPPNNRKTGTDEVTIQMCRSMFTRFSRGQELLRRNHGVPVLHQQDVLDQFIRYLNTQCRVPAEVVEMLQHMRDGSLMNTAGGTSGGRLPISSACMNKEPAFIQSVCQSLFGR